MYDVVREHANVPAYDSRVWDGQIRMLRTVDSEVEQIRQALDARGDLDNTIVVYMSDNGLLLGEHRLEGKRLPYTEATSVPFAMAAPGRIPAGTVDTRLVSNVDVAPTILAAADPGARFATRSTGTPCSTGRGSGSTSRGVLQRAPRQALGAAVAVDPKRRLPVHRVAVPDLPRAHGLARVL